MRALIGIASLLVVLAIVGTLAKKQLAATRVPAAAPQTSGPAAPTGTVREQSQQIQQQVQQQMEGLMQKPRPMPDDDQ